MLKTIVSKITLFVSFIIFVLLMTSVYKASAQNLFAGIAAPSTISAETENSPTVDDFPKGSKSLLFSKSSESVDTAPFALTDRLAPATNTDVDTFGTSVAVDGDYAIVGAPSKTVGNNKEQGTAYIYFKEGGEWKLQQSLVAPNGSAGDTFGRSVAIEGNTAAVCLSAYDGIIYIYVRDQNTWTLQAQLMPNNGGVITNGSVAISGNTLVVGTYSNAAYVFVRNGDAWTQQAKLVANDVQPYDYFGSSASISGDTILLGAYGDEPGPVREERGSAYIFTRSGTVWTQKAKLTAPDSHPFAQFGGGVDVDGSTAVVGAPLASSNPGLYQGAVYIFVNDGTSWIFQQKAIPPETTNVGLFGLKVSVSGETMIASAPTSNVNSNTGQGAAYVFKRNGNAWIQLTKISAPDGRQYQRFGTDIAVSADTLIVGASGDLFYGYSEPGAAYMFGNADTPKPELQTVSDTGISNTDNITNSRNPSFDVTNITIGAKIELVRNGTVISNTTANSNTLTLFDNNPAANGTFQYNVRQTLPNNTVLRSAAELVTFDTVSPTITINKGDGPPETNASTLSFIAIFSEPVTSFEPSDISLADSTANVAQATIVINGNHPTYAVTVSGFASNGQTVKASVPAGATTDTAGNPNLASTSANNTLIVDNVRPTLTINQAVGQSDPTTTLPINFTVIFSEPVTGFDGNDISLTQSSANVSSPSISVTGSGTTYSVAISNISSNGGFVKASVEIRYAVNDAFGNGNEPSTSTDNTVSFDNLGPSVTINQVTGQADPATFLPINFTAVFSEAVTGFDKADVSLIGSLADVSRASIEVTGNGTTYAITVSNIATAGLIRARILGGAVINVVGNPSTLSTSTDNTVRYSPQYVGISGRVSFASGRGAGNVQLILTLPNGEQRYSRTNQFGYYRFNNIQTSNVLISLVSKKSVGLNTTFYLQGEYLNLNLTLP